MDSNSRADNPEFPKYLKPVPEGEDAPEVRPSSKPILACPDHEQKQAAWIDDPKFSELSTSVDSCTATVSRGAGSSPSRKTWIFVIGCCTVAAILTVSIVLGVHFGKREDKKTYMYVPASGSVNTSSPSVSTSTSRVEDVTTPDSPMSTFIAQTTSAVDSYTTTTTIAAATAEPIRTAAEDLGCYEQGNPDKQAPLCAQPSCPSGYGSVFWDFGCPDGMWKCCF